MNVPEIFERLSPLANDPEAFEQEAAKVREEFLSTISDPAFRQRMEAIIWRRNIALDKIKNPDSRREAAYGHLLQDLFALRDAWNTLPVKK